MVNVQWRNVINDEKGKRAQELTNKAQSKFFSLGVKQIQDECNTLARKYSEKWSQTPESKIPDLPCANILCKKGVMELEKNFSLFEPADLTFDFSNSKNDTSPASQCFLEGTKMKSLITIYLGNVDHKNGYLKWIGICDTFEEGIFHELAHACGDVEYLPISNTECMKTGICDGIIRHNLIISKSISNLSERRPD